MLAAHRIWHPPAKVSITLRGVSNIASANSPQTLTLPVTTNAGDCIVIAYSCAGTPALVGSGAGATWTGYGSAVGPAANLLVGAGASAGQTSCIVSGGQGPSGNGGSVVVSVWSGIASVSPTQGSESTSSGGTTRTTPSLTYTTGSLVVAASSQYGGTTPPTVTWSNADVNTNASAGNYLSRPVSLDYVTDPSSTSTSCTALWTNSENGGTVIVALTPI